jgi:hypothetical protein
MKAQCLNSKISIFGTNGKNGVQKRDENFVAGLIEKTADTLNMRVWAQANER